MSSDELKPCPFCGGDAETRRARQQSDGSWFPAMCGCRRCDVWMYGDDTYRTRGFARESDYEESMGQAVRRWNDRPKHVAGELAVKIHPRIDFDKTADEFEKAAEKLREAVEHE